VLLSTLVALTLSADPFAVLEVPDAGWAYVESGPDAGTARHTWTTREVTHVGKYTSLLLQGDDVLPTVRVFLGPKGLSAAVDPMGRFEPQTAAAISKHWSTPDWGLYLPAKLAAGAKASFSYADPQQVGTLKGVLRAHAPGGVEVTYEGRVCFLDDCTRRKVELTFVPGVGFTHLCLADAPACFELTPDW
jgi:hypothetical protein